MAVESQYKEKLIRSRVSRLPERDAGRHGKGSFVASAFMIYSVTPSCYEG